jgi:SAM-dependent methyltransferase
MARAGRALLLGVTPEIQALFHRRGEDDLIAVDHTPAMIDALWRGPRKLALCAEWTSLPLATSSRDVAICDGGLHLLPYPQGQVAMAQSLHRVLAPNGSFILRLFVPPERRESIDVVLDDLLAGRVPSLNVLKLRLGAAMQANARTGVRLADVWETLAGAAPNFESLAKRIGWDLQHLLAINTYRDCPKRYHFVTIAETEELFRANGFELERTDVPTSYDLCDRCPTVVFRRR